MLVAERTALLRYAKKACEKWQLNPVVCPKGHWIGSLFTSSVLHCTNDLLHLLL